jgi:hypothetical protein
VNYISKEPSSDDQKTGYKFPFNSSEILCSENVFVIDKFFEDLNNTSIDEKENIEEAGVDLRTSIVFNHAVESIKEGVENLNIENVESAVTEETKEEEIVMLDSPQKSPKKELKAEDKKITYPIIDHLFSSLDIDSSLNYVLAGYFYKFFNHLSNFRNSQLMTYILFHRRNFVSLMIRHLNRKSISDCLVKVMVSYIPNVQDQDFKKELLLMIIDSFDSKSEEVKF